MGEVELSNKKAIDIKHQRVIEEKQLEQKIVDYNKLKTQREEEHLEEIRRQQAEKEKEI